MTEFIYQQLIEKDLIDPEDKNKGIIRGVDLNTNNNSGVFVCRSTEDGKKLQLLDGTYYKIYLNLINHLLIGIKLLGNTLRVATYNEQIIDGENPKDTVGASMALANNAQLSAKSAAIAFAALKSFSSNDQVGINLSANTGN